MIIVDASAVLENATPNALKEIELVARNCYKSEGKICDGSAERLIRSVLRKDPPHLGILDHAHARVRFVVDRGISHEIVRHRIGVGYAQESTRFVNYGRAGGVAFVRPCFLEPGAPRWDRWVRAMERAERDYLDDLADGASPQEARALLPTSTKTELVATGSFSFWRNFFALRCDAAAHPQMREVAVPLRAEFASRWPAVFEETPR